MNYSLAVFLLEDKVRLIGVSYEKVQEGKPSSVYSFKTLDQSIKVDDIVVVPTKTRHDMTICKVIEVDIRPDFDSTTEVEWLIGKVNPESIADTKALEALALTKIKDADYARKKAELQKDLGFAAAGLEAFRERSLDEGKMDEKSDNDTVSGTEPDTAATGKNQGHNKT